MNIRALCLACFLVLDPLTARAQVSATVTIASDERFRGRSVSRGDPAVSIALSSDDPSGIYASVAGTIAMVKSSPEIVNVQANIGYVHPISAQASLEIGVVQSNYSKYASGDHAAHYTEIYAGVLTRNLAFRANFSPNYFGPKNRTLYLEVDGTVELGTDWHLIGHVGSLVRLSNPAPPRSSRIGYDWRFGAARSVGAVELQVALSDGGPARERYSGADHDRLAATISLVWSL